MIWGKRERTRNDQKLSNVSFLCVEIENKSNKKKSFSKWIFET